MDRAPDRIQEEKISGHILNAAGTMVGVCVTLIGLVKINEGRTGPSRVDEYAACAAFVFLLSAILSYLSLRGGSLHAQSRSLEKGADALFILGLIAISVVAILFAYEII